MSSLGELLVQTARVVPQGVLVFFASYSQLHHCVRQWQVLCRAFAFLVYRSFQENTQEINVWTRLNSAKAVFIEPHLKSEFHQAVVNFTTAVENGKGGMMLAVCRGKVIIVLFLCAILNQASTKL